MMFPRSDYGEKGGALPRRPPPWSARLGIDKAFAPPHDLIIALLGDRRVHLHLAVAFARHHLGRTARPFGNLRVVERHRNGVPLQLAGSLDRHFPKPEAAIHARGRTARREQDLPSELLVVL